jgi:hypothetical protein
LCCRDFPFAATVKIMPEPTARELDLRAAEARAITHRMRDPRAKRTMANLALSYERLAKHAAMREETEIGRLSRLAR